MDTVVQNIHVGAGQLKVEDNNSTDDDVEYKATEEGATLAISRNVEFIEIAEAIGATGGYITGEECTLSVSSLEASAEHIREALGHGTIETTAAGTTQKGLDELSFGGSFEMFDRKLTYTAPRRHNSNLNIIIELYKVVAVTDMDPQFQKSDPTGFGVQFRAINDMTKDAGKRLGKITIETAEETG